MSELMQKSRLKEDNYQICEYMWSGLLVDMEEP